MAQVPTLYPFGARNITDCKLCECFRLGKLFRPTIIIISVLSVLEDVNRDEDRPSSVYQ